MSSEMTLVPRTIILRSSGEARRFAYQLSWRDIECYAPEQLEKFVNGGSEILCWGGFLVQDRTQNVPRFLLHGAAVLRGSNAEPPFQSFFFSPPSMLRIVMLAIITFSLEQCQMMQ